MTADPSDFGPLPEGDRNDELQRLSIAALQKCLPVERFLYRDERADDKGLDGSLELKSGGCFTNFRANVQLKGTDSTKINQNGSVSLRVEPSNLNYLLNGPCPLYILWIAPRDELRYVWARDEATRLHRENPAWMMQEKITLHFTRTLSPVEWDGIADRMLQEGRAQRQLQDILARATIAEQVVVGIDGTRLVITDRGEVYETLNACGMAIVGAGYAKAVLDHARLLSPVQAAEPHLQLVCAYAQLTLGDYFTASGHLARARMGQDRLSPLDRYFLQGLVLACEHQLGRIAADAFFEGQERLESAAPPELAVQFRLDRLRLQHLSERDHGRRAALLQDLQAAAQQIRSDATTPTSMKLQARLVTLYAQGQEAHSAYAHTVTQLLMRRQMGMAPGTASGLAALRESRQADERLHTEVGTIIEEAVREQHPLLLAEAILTRAIIVAAHIADGRFLLTTIEGHVSEIPEKVFQIMEQQLRHAAQIFERAGCWEGHIRAVLLLADWYDLNDRSGDARKRAQSVLGTAQALGYERHISHAEEHITGNTDYRRLMSLLTGPRDMDPVIADATDAEMARLAEDCLAAMDLPADRLPAVQRECLAMRDLARERMDWCRHIELLQDQRHSLSPATHFLRDPSRRCACEKLGHRSRIETPDWTPLVPAFKQCYCAGCPDREPKGRPCDSKASPGSKAAHA
jgi:hypothetical protein